MKPTVDQLIEAYRSGHAWNPAYPNLANLDEGRIRLMSGDERDARDLIASRQASDINMDVLVAAYHQREPEFDGDVGPATEALLNIPRCPIPDYAPPPNATFHYDDPALQAAVESQQRAAAEPAMVGAYWRGCDAESPNIHSYVLGLDITRAPSNWKANQDLILDAYRKALAEIGIRVRIVLNPQSMTGLNQFQEFQGIAGSTIGYNYFPQSNSCSRIPNGRLDTGYNPTNWKLHAGLILHESGGHGIGFNHTRGGVMNSSILLVDPVSYVNGPEWPQVKRYYPGVPLSAPVPPTPPTDPGTPPTLPASLKLPITITDADGKRYGLHPFTEV